MNFATMLLLNVLVLAGGLFAYDQLRSDQRTPSDEIASKTRNTSEPTRQRPAMLGSAGPLAQLRATVERQQSTIDALQERLLAWAKAAADDVPRAALSGINSKTEGSPFDEGTLHALQVYMDELTRRRKAAHNSDRITKAVRAIGVDLSEHAEGQAVVDETISFQKKTQELMYSPFSRDAKGERERASAFERIRQSYESSVRKMLPARDATLLLESKLGRTAGLYKKRDYDAR